MRKVWKIISTVVALGLPILVSLILLLAFFFIVSEVFSDDPLASTAGAIVHGFGT